MTRPASHHTTTTPTTTKETAMTIQIRCTCCERTDTADITDGLTRQEQQ